MLNYLVMHSKCKVKNIKNSSNTNYMYLFFVFQNLSFLPPSKHGLTEFLQNFL